MDKLNSDSVIEVITSSMGMKPYANVLVVLAQTKRTAGGNIWVIK